MCAPVRVCVAFIFFLLVYLDAHKFNVCRLSRTPGAHEPLSRPTSGEFPSLGGAARSTSSGGACRVAFIAVLLCCFAHVYVLAVCFFLSLILRSRTALGAADLPANPFASPPDRVTGTSGLYYYSPPPSSAGSLIAASPFSSTYHLEGAFGW